MTYATGQLKGMPPTVRKCVVVGFNTLAKSFAILAKDWRAIALDTNLPNDRARAHGHVHVRGL